MLLCVPLFASQTFAKCSGARETVYYENRSTGKNLSITLIPPTVVQTR